MQIKSQKRVEITQKKVGNGCCKRYKKCKKEQRYYER